MESYIGQICLFGFNFAPQNWAFCNGQLMSIAQNSALFALLGTTYGGDGVTTFALPNLQGRVPMHQGNNHEIGERGGSEEVTLTAGQMPMHSHNAVLKVSPERANTDSALNHSFGSSPIFDPEVAEVAMSPSTISVDTAGSSQAHSNMQPYLTVNYCICLYGIFPPRN